MLVLEWIQCDIIQDDTVLVYGDQQNFGLLLNVDVVFSSFSKAEFWFISQALMYVRRLQSFVSGEWRLI